LKLISKTIKLHNDFELQLDIGESELNVSLWRKNDSMPTGYEYHGENNFDLNLNKTKQRGNFV